jgi:hypothetical protein
MREQSSRFSPGNLCCCSSQSCSMDGHGQQLANAQGRGVDPGSGWIRIILPDPVPYSTHQAMVTLAWRQCQSTGTPVLRVSGIRCFFDPWISIINIPFHISESIVTTFWIKNTLILFCGSGIRGLFDPGQKNSDPRPDLQHLPVRTATSHYRGLYYHWWFF